MARTDSAARARGGAADRLLGGNGAQHSNTPVENPDGAKWAVHRLDTFEARLTAIIDCPWVLDWFKGVALGKALCIHCGGTCRDAGLVGATRMDGGRLLTITACHDCYARSASFEAAARAAVDAADAGMLTSGRSFRHAVAGPEASQ